MRTTSEVVDGMMPAPFAETPSLESSSRELPVPRVRVAGSNHGHDERENEDSQRAVLVTVHGRASFLRVIRCSVPHKPVKMRAAPS